eukprot:GHRR01036123.1.p1 GENE.GHRR01036123.1~~GHRR01036123.1.p1  ORF type:complete len:154 (-),score=29.94 GHRR01036123.1:147-608(-)
MRCCCMAVTSTVRSIIACLAPYKCSQSIFPVFVCALQGSDANNVIPDSVTLAGTLRALTHEQMMYMKQRIDEAVPAVVAAFKCNGTVNWGLDHHPYYPPLVNDPGAAAFARTVASGVLGGTNVGMTLVYRLLSCRMTSCSCKMLPSAHFKHET